MSDWPVTTTVAPALASRVAVAAPIPPVPPRMTATFPSRSLDTLVSALSAIGSNEFREAISGCYPLRKRGADNHFRVSASPGFPPGRQPRYEAGLCPAL